MTLCNQWGIPHSQFLSWSPEDRAKALAYAAEKGQRCDLCGTAEYEWAEDKRAFEPVGSFCMGCYLKSIYEEDESFSPGTYVTMMRTGTVEHAQHLMRMRREHG